MKQVYITDIGVALPNSAIENEEMESVLGQAGERPSRARRIILRSNGIKKRYYAIDPVTGEATHNNAQLTADAVRQLVKPGFGLADIDCLVCGTSMPDQLMPNHGVMVQGELGNSSCEVVATSGVCIAGMTAMKYAYLGVANGEFTNAVATGSELASAVLRGDFFHGEIAEKVDALQKYPEVAFEKDFLRWMLSDGAGAVRLQDMPAKAGISLKIEWIVQRSYAGEQPACMYAGAIKNENGELLGWKNIPANRWSKDSVFSVKQDVRQLNDNIIHYTIDRPLPDIVAEKGLCADDVDYFLPHYSSEYFRQKLAIALERCDFNIPSERWFTTLVDKGNTGSASIYIMLDELFHSGRLSAGQRILCLVPESGRFSTSFMLLSVVGNEV